MSKSNTIMRDNLDERAMIFQLEEENNEMLREMAILEQQKDLGENNGQLNGLRERTAELETKMREKQQMRRKLMQQLEHLMTSPPNLATGLPSNSMSLGYYSKPLNGVSNMINNAFRDSNVMQPLSASGPSSNIRAGSVPASQLQGDLLQAADAITTNMSHLVQELDQDSSPEQKPDEHETEYK